MNNNIERVGVWTAVVVALIGGILMVMGGVSPEGDLTLLGAGVFAFFYCCLTIGINGVLGKK